MNLGGLRFIKLLVSCVHNFCRVAEKHLVTLDSYFLCLVFIKNESVGPLGSSLFWDLRFFGALGSYDFWGPQVH